MLDVALLLLLLIFLMSVAMPKFKVMQQLVDRLNLVSREILTGIMPVRAFSREKFEEQRFDKANRYGLFRSYFVPERHCKSLFQRDCQKERRTPSRKVSDSGESVREVRRSVSVK